MKWLAVILSGVAIGGCVEKGLTDLAVRTDVYPAGDTEGPAEMRALMNARAKSVETRNDVSRSGIGSETDIKTLEQARAYFDPLPGSSALLLRPNPDGRYYELNTFISEELGDGLLSWWPEDWAHTGYRPNGIAVGAVFERPAFVYEGFRAGRAVNVVGRYTGYRDVRLPNGELLTVPVFENAFIFR